MSKPESETDPWAKVRTFDVSTYGDCRMERDYYGEIASEQKYQRGEYAWVDEVDAARAAEAAQHQQEIAALKKQVSGLSMECARRAEVIAAVEAERDQLYPTPEPETRLAVCDVCVTAAHCNQHWRCLAECTPSDLKVKTNPCVWRITTGPLGTWVTPSCVEGSIPAPWGTERAKSCHLCGSPLRLVPSAEPK